MTDQQILEEIHRNANKGYSLLLDNYQRPLYFYVRKIVFSHDDADDIMQNVWIKVFHNIHNFRQDSKLSTWLFKIATNETYNFLAKLAKRNNVSIENIAELKANSLQNDLYFEGDEISQILYKNVAKLPAKQRQVFQLKYFENKKYEEIAEILETSVGALKASYHHAVQKLKTNIPAELII